MFQPQFLAIFRDHDQVQVNIQFQPDVIQLYTILDPLHKKLINCTQIQDWDWI